MQLGPSQEAARGAAASQPEAKVQMTLADRLGIPDDRLQTFFDWFTTTERTLTLYSMGVNQSSAGTDKANAIINCHLATGRIGRPGMGPFSVTGQPNAMGGREVGGLANLLSAHRDMANPQHRAEVAAIWGVDALPATPGKTAIPMFDAIAAGQIKPQDITWMQLGPQSKSVTFLDNMVRDPQSTHRAAAPFPPRGPPASA